MPRVSRRIKRKRRASWYTPRHINELKTGKGDFFDDMYGNESFPSRLECWSDLKSEILETWISKHPYSRPAAWWAYDAPARRERIDGKPHPYDREDCPECMKKYSFGLPCCFATKNDTKAEYESEETFLRRHELLLPEEM